MFGATWSAARQTNSDLILEDAEEQYHLPETKGMELRLFSCLSFLWPEKGTNRDAYHGAAPGPDSCPWDLAPLLRRINDPAELRRVLHCLGDGGITGQIPLSRLLLPFKLYRPSHSAADDGDGDEGGTDREEAEDERLVAVEDVVAAVTESDSQGCVRSLISAFRFFDRDGDGVISGGDLLLALRDVVRDAGDGETPSATVCEEMVAAFDWERVGGVCFADFVRMMMGPDSESSPSGRPALSSCGAGHLTSTICSIECCSGYIP